MKILQVIPYFNPKMGGDVKSCYTISWQLKQRGHDVTIITTNYEFDDGYANAIETDGVEVLPFTCSVNIKSYIYIHLR